MSKVTFDDKKVTGKVCPEFRVSFENVHKPKGYKNGEPKYSITMLFPKKTDLSALKKAAEKAAEEKWGDKKNWPKTLKIPFRDGDKESDQPGYEGMIFVRASSKEKPTLIDQKREPIDSDEEGRRKFYSGCWAKATIVAFAYEAEGNKGVSFSLLGVQKTRDGERFGGRRPVEEEFDVQDDGSDDASSYESEETESAGMGF